VQVHAPVNMLPSGAARVLRQPIGRIFMRLVLLCAAFAAAPVLANDLVARQGSDSVRLGDGPCTSQSVLGQIDPQLHSQYKSASAVVQGRTFTACWRKRGNVAHLMYEDGDQGIVPMAELKPEWTT
jgi:hypothetical protein